MGFETKNRNNKNGNQFQCKFTPLGFETGVTGDIPESHVRCKFTPLGFETLHVYAPFVLVVGVNLPRWGLKPRLG